MCTSTLPENGALAKRGPGKTGTQLSSNNAGTPAIFPDPPIGPVEKRRASAVMRLAYQPWPVARPRRAQHVRAADLNRRLCGRDPRVCRPRLSPRHFCMPSRPTPRWRLRGRRPRSGRSGPAAASICSLLTSGAWRFVGRVGGSVPVDWPDAGGSLAGKVISSDLSTFFCLASPMGMASNLGLDLDAPAAMARSPRRHRAADLVGCCPYGRNGAITKPVPKPTASLPARGQKRARLAPHCKFYHFARWCRATLGRCRLGRRAILPPLRAGKERRTSASVAIGHGRGTARPHFRLGERRRGKGGSLAGCMRTLSRSISLSVVGRRCFLSRSRKASSASS